LFSYLKFRFGPRHRFQTYTGSEDTGVYRLAGDSYFAATTSADEAIRISIAGDWGTGTEESDRVAEEWRTQDGVLTGSRIDRGLEDPKLIAVRDFNVAIGGARSQAAG